MKQKEIVLDHLKRYGEITTWDGFVEYGITRVPAYICELRQEGYDIETIKVVKKRGDRTVNFARYEMKKGESR